MSKIRVAVAGLVHDHVWHVAEGFLSHPQAELVAVADPHEELVQKAKAAWGVARAFDCAVDMLDQTKPDAVIVYTNNAAACEVVEEAAGRGIHVMVEKPMAATLEQADRMLQAARKGGVKLMVNWPTAWSPGFAAAVQAAQQGQIGRVFKVRYRAAHQGPRELGCSPYFCEWLYDKKRNGAGALMDYCCYGADYAAFFLGRPNAVTAVAGRLVKDTITVEDNAVILAKYTEGLAICEASWSQYGFGYELMINGTAGSIRSDGASAQIYTEDRPDIRSLPVSPLPTGENNAASYFLRCITTDQPVTGICDPVVSRNAQEILEAGVLAAEGGCSVSIPVVSRR